MEFPFPFKPYAIQSNLMRNIYDCIEAGNVGIFESPTGTGKSLSIICSTFYWLRNCEKAMIEKQKESIKENSKTVVNAADDWLAALTQSYDAKKGKESLDPSVIEEYENLQKRLKELLKKNPKELSQDLYKKAMYNKKLKEEGAVDEDLEVEFLISEDSVVDDTDKFETNAEDALSISEKLKLPKIIYCSRTHSQISQFMNEIKRTEFRDMRCVVVGSRKNMCVNPSVTKKACSDAHLNELCLDMQKSKGSGSNSSSIHPSSSSSNQNTVVKRQKSSKSSGPCEFHNKAREHLCSEYALAQIRDIEEIVELGNTLDACPYYASRSAVAMAEVICLPYSALLHADVRASLNVSLKDNVVIIDEGHNIVDAVSSVQSCRVSYSDLCTAGKAIECYLGRFSSVLSGQNLFSLNILSSLISKLKDYLSKTAPKMEGKEFSEIKTVSNLMFSVQIDNINMVQLYKHFTSANTLQKIGGFAEYWQRKNTIPVVIDSSTIGGGSTNGVMSSYGYTNALRGVLDFVYKLMNMDSHCRVLVNSVFGVDTANVSTEAQSRASYSFILLNPAVYFKSILEEARSVIIVGGTMNPTDYIVQQLGLPAGVSQGTDDHNIGNSERVRRLVCYACSHVIPDENIRSYVVGSSTSPPSTPLTFTHSTTGNYATEVGLYQTIVDISAVVPYGMVVFFTSYHFMEKTIQTWRGLAGKGFPALSKPLFVEKRKGSDSEEEQFFTRYSELAVASRTGALLCSVIGGKLSEGINFSDRLARCVVVIGMPYPNKTDAVLQEKLRFIDESQSGSGIEPATKLSSARLYESLCMKAVNQSIGRSVRHINDYSAIVLIDQRYRQQHIIDQLPRWCVMNNRLMKVSDSAVPSSLMEFYQLHNEV